MIDAVDPTHIHLTSTSYIYKVFDKLYAVDVHMDVSHHVLAAHADQDLGISLLKIWATLS